MSESYRVRVSKDALVFSAAHFITYDGDKCESLHGHNFRAAVVVESELDINSYVFDFIALKNLMQELTSELDHKMLLPASNPHFETELRDTVVKVAYQDRQWIFPRCECVVLPIQNTTVELIAGYFARRLLDNLHRQFKFIPRLLEVEVEENFGQNAIYTWKRETATERDNA